MKPLKVIFNRPIYRKDILKYASKHYSTSRGMCAAIIYALIIYQIDAIVPDMFSKYFNLKIAIDQFGATKDSRGYWWSNDKLGWYHRKSYFKWLIKQYKDDKEDLRKYRSHYGRL